MFARHDLVWLTSRGWERVLASEPVETAGAVAALEAWRAAGWPAVVRRSEVDLAPGEVAIGFALPPRVADGRKLRVACRAELSDIGRRTRALPLVGALDAVPAAWRAPLAALEREAAGAGLGLAVYGSVALEALTGQRYLTSTSDIDLLLRPMNRTQLVAGLDMLDRHAAWLPLDGEVMFADGRAVAWKELQTALEGAPGTRVLAKGIERVGLVMPEELMATFEERTWID